MRITVPRETKAGETRVALTPDGAAALVAVGHEVGIEAGAGEGSGFSDQDYADAGVTVGGVDQAWSGDLVLKVKEPTPQEYPLLRDNALFTYLHLAANAPLARALCEAGTLGLSYDTYLGRDGTLPLLAPMSEIAGRLAVIEGTHHLLKPQGGRGVLMSPVTGAEGAQVAVLGAGVAGASAVEQAAQMGARVTVLDLVQARLDALAARWPGQVQGVLSSPDSVEHAVLDADLVVGAVLVPGSRAPVVVPHRLVERTRPGTVFVDIAIDQGGCFEDSRPTTHAHPTFVESGAVFYCVANMPGAVGHTATRALTAATLPVIAALASGPAAAIDASPELASAVNTRAGRVVHPTVAAGLGLE